jgi:hypothetical protein
MENSSSGKTQFVLLQGAILGALNVALLAVLYLFGKYNSGWTALVWLIYFAFIPWSIVKLRNTFMGGYITYGESLGHGLKISILSGVIVGFFNFLIFKNDSTLAKEFVSHLEEGYLAAGMTEAQVEQMGGLISIVTNPWFLLFSNMLGGVFYGLIVSLIISFTTMRKKDPFQDAMKTVEND